MGKEIWYIDVSVLLLHSSTLWKSTDLGYILNNKAMNWKTWCSYTNQRYFLDLGCIVTWRYACVRSMEIAQSLAISTVLLTWLSPFSPGRKVLLLEIIFRSLLTFGMVGDKNHEFPNAVLFPLPISWEVCEEEYWLRFIGTTYRGGTDLNGNEPVLNKERTHLLSVNSSHWSAKWANLPPTGMSGHSRIGSGKDWISEFCGRWGLLRGGELFLISTFLSILLFTWWEWKCLNLGLYGCVCWGLEGLVGCFGLLKTGGVG